MFKEQHSLTAARAKLFLVADQSLRLCTTESKVADILEHEAASTVRRWVSLVRNEPQLCVVHLHNENLCAHLPGLFGDLMARLRFPIPVNSPGRLLVSAAEYGCVRYQQGYSPAMMVEESRLLVLSIIETMQNSLKKLDRSQVLSDVMVITNEIDAQLAEAISAFVWQSKYDVLPSEG